MGEPRIAEDIRVIVSKYNHYFLMMEIEYQNVNDPKN